MNRFWLCLALVLPLHNFIALAEPTLPPSADVVDDAFPLAMEGFCPVTLSLERKWKHGEVRFGAIHRRRTFLFAGEVEQQKFLKDPDAYTPVLTGYDPLHFVRTGEFIDGSPKFSCTFRKQAYLFVDAASVEFFMQNPQKACEDLNKAIKRVEGKEAKP